MSTKSGLNAYFDIANCSYNAKHARMSILLNLIVDQANSFGKRSAINEPTRAFASLAYKTIDYLLKTRTEKQHPQPPVTNEDYLIQDFIYTRQIHNKCDADNTYKHYSHYMRYAQVEAEATSSNSLTVEPHNPVPCLKPIQKRASLAEPELEPIQKRASLAEPELDFIVCDENTDISDEEWLPATELELYNSNTDSTTDLETADTTDVVANTIVVKPIKKLKRKRKNTFKCKKVLNFKATTKESLKFSENKTIVQHPIKPYKPLIFLKPTVPFSLAHL